MPLDKVQVTTAAAIVAAVLLTTVMTSSDNASADTGNGMVVPMYV